MRDEVLAALHVTDRQAVIQGEVFVSGGEFSREQAQLRYQIFRRELPLL
ncbi:staygreen family protein [Priestia sp. OVS21]|nr:staygreen family protein [Priestia sp. OVS21]